MTDLSSIPSLSLSLSLTLSYLGIQYMMKFTSLLVINVPSAFNIPNSVIKVEHIIGHII